MARIRSVKKDGKRYAQINHGESRIDCGKTFMMGEVDKINLRFDMGERRIHLELSVEEWENLRKTLESMTKE